MYCADYREGMENNTSLNGFEEVIVPHTCKEIPLNNFDETQLCFISCYKKNFLAPAEWAGKRVFIKFEAVSSVADVYLNGVHIGQHKGGYTEFEYELTEHIRIGEENQITVVDDSTERNDVPPFGYVIDYLCYGGIYREVSLIVSDELRIHHMHLKPENVMQPKCAANVRLFTNSTEAMENVSANAVLYRYGREVARVEKSVDIVKGEGAVDLHFAELENIERWTLESPALYTVKAKIGDTEISDRFGFREPEFRVDGFYLNGERVQITGLNRHQSYPYVGYAMPQRAQRADANVMKYDLNVNFVRTSHYPQSRHFLDRCDEIGLLVFEEIPGWQTIGGDEWRDLSVKNVHDMVMAGFNHPAIIMWGVRINESGNDFELYERTNRAAHELDNSRPTGGVKYMECADFQEDVFVMNDFESGLGKTRHRDQNLSTGLDYDVPYLISEFAGALIPTRRWDNAQQRSRQAVVFANGNSDARLDKRVCGIVGWCAFDYNSHCQFGNGERVCYHGVADMFRIPKTWASAAYTSQCDVKEKPILVPATTWTNGDLDGGGFLPMYIFSNCDYVEFYYNGKLGRRLFPCKQEFAGLEHPPMVMRRIYDGVFDRWGWEDAEFVGYANGEEVIRRRMPKAMLPTTLEIAADDSSIRCQQGEEPYDVTRVTFVVKDQYGNSCDYLMDWIEIEVEGDAELIGPAKTTLQGGVIAAWIRSTDRTGKVKISARTSTLESESVIIDIK